MVVSASGMGPKCCGASEGCRFSECDKEMRAGAGVWERDTAEGTMGMKKGGSIRKSGQGRHHCNRWANVMVSPCQCLSKQRLSSPERIV